MGPCQDLGAILKLGCESHGLSLSLLTLLFHMTEVHVPKNTIREGITDFLYNIRLNVEVLGFL